MKKEICSFVFMALAILISPNVAQALPDETGEYTKLGVGNLECGLWTQAQQIGDVNAVWWKTLILGWVQGFLSAYNFYVPGTSNITKETDSQGVARWIDDYCLHHRADSISDAAEALVAELLRPHRAQLNGAPSTPR